MHNLPFYVYLTFGATVLTAVWLMYRATQYSKLFLIVSCSWITFQSILSISGFYHNPDMMTTRFPLLIVPALCLLVVSFSSKKGRAFIDQLDLPTLTILQVIRIPVEIVLVWLFFAKAIPEAMTFHGRNFNVISGISAPIVFYFGFIKKTIGKTGMLIWNFVCLALLLNVVSMAILALPGRYEQFGFEHPNIALGFFPFILLPAFLVPVVLFSTLASIRQLLGNNLKA